MPVTGDLHVDVSGTVLASRRREPHADPQCRRQVRSDDDQRDPRPYKDGDEPALAKALSLTATPQEFDEGFVAALQGYREARQSLADQVEATREVLEAAKLASVKKAADANAKARADKPMPTQKPAVPSAPPLGPASDTDIDEHHPSPDLLRVQAQGVGEEADLFG